MLTVLLEYINLFSLTDKDFQYTENNYTYYASIMLDAFKYLYAKNYADIIGRGLIMTNTVDYHGDIIRNFSNYIFASL